MPTAQNKTKLFRPLSIKSCMQILINFTLGKFALGIISAECKSLGKQTHAPRAVLGNLHSHPFVGGKKGGVENVRNLCECRVPYSDLLHRLFSLMRVFRLSARELEWGGCRRVSQFSAGGPRGCATRNRVGLRPCTHTHRRRRHRRSLRSQLVLSQWEKRAICFLRSRRAAPNSICLPKCARVCESVALCFIRPFPPLFALFALAPRCRGGWCVFRPRHDEFHEIRQAREIALFSDLASLVICTRHKIPAWN